METAARVWSVAMLLGLGAAGLDCHPRKPLAHGRDGGPAVETVEGSPPTADPSAPRPAEPAVPLAMEHEPNDGPEQAQSLEAGSGVRGSLAPPTSLGAGKGDDDYYVYRSPATPQLLNVDLVGGPAAELQLELLGAAGQRLALVDEHPRGEGERLANLVLSPNQSYYLRVRGTVTATGNNPADSEYRLSLSAAPAPPGSELEPNDAPLLASAALGSDLTGALSHRKDEDYWVLSLPEALGMGRRAADASAPQEGIRSPAVLRIELFSPGVVPSVRVFAEAAPPPAAVLDLGPAPAPTAAVDGGTRPAPVLTLLAEVTASKGVTELRLRNLTLPAGSLRAYVAVRGASFIRPPGEARYHLKLTAEPQLEDAEVEPNDDCAHANLVTLEGRGAGAGEGTIAGFLWPGDVDCYRLRPLTAGPTHWQIKLALPGGEECQAALDLVRGGEPPVKGTSDASGALDLRTRGDVLLRVSSRERKTCFEAPYRLSAQTEADAGPAKP